MGIVAVVHTYSNIMVPQQYGLGNKKHLVWANLIFLLGRHLQTTFSIVYYIGFSVEFTTEPYFLTQFFFLSPKSVHSFWALSYWRTYALWALHCLLYLCLLRSNVGSLLCRSFVTSEFVSLWDE